ncbi:family 43 glycosylhydrolase [Pendulispora albinea]|uniref:Family 43 glycosylhydrolase n=1 Tax=Pendulispora albinea TaxID=2741071 RepID=A0ABZ2LZ64_9BACT
MTSIAKKVVVGGTTGALAAMFAWALPGHSAMASDGDDRGRERWLTSAPLEHVYDPTPPGGPARYLNDHTFIRGRDGTWHMFGIIGDAAPPGEFPDGGKELDFAHATARDLMGPWTTQPHALHVDRSYYGEDHLWAPHVIESEGTYYMFYAAGGNGAAINLATSTDLFHWKRIPSGPLFRGLVARDPFVIKIGTKWVMYYCELAGWGGHHIVAARTSSDLLHWSEPTTVFTDPNYDPFPSTTESPFLIQRDGVWYLLIGPRRGYVGTDVFRSRDPFSFSIDGYAGYLPSHAAELVEDRRTTWVSGAGSFEHGIYFAPLEWRRTPPVWPSPQNPAVALDDTGRIQLFLVDPGDGRILRRKQIDPRRNTWSCWEVFGEASGAAPTIGRNADGRLELFAVAPDGSRLLHRVQLRANGDRWGQWETFGGPAGAAPTVARNADGRLEVFAIGPAGRDVAHRWQTSAGGDWSQWEVFGTAAGGPPSVHANADGRLEVFAIGPGNGYLAHRWQTTPSGGWSNWEIIGGPAAATPSMALGADGRLGVFAVSPYGAGIALLAQSSPNGGWNDWRGFSSWADPSPTLVQNADGRLEAIKVTPGGEYILHRWQNGDGTWNGNDITGWQSFGGEPVSSTPSAVRDRDGLIHVFAISANGAVLSEIVQDAPSSGWGEWSRVRIEH